MSDVDDEHNEELREAVEEVRRVRHEISARFDHDVGKFGEYIGEYQKKFGDRLIQPPERKKRERPAA